jgi:hypothetical protein
MPYQQPVVSEKTIRVGSVKVEVGDSVSSLVSLGTGNAAKFSEKMTKQDLISDNGGLIKTLVKEQTCEVDFTMLEIDLNILQQARGGIDEYSTVAGDPVTITAEGHGTGWTVGTPFRLTHKNGAGTIVTGIVVKAAGSALAAGTDYNTFVGDGSTGLAGYTYVVPVTAQTAVITADYIYTPNAAVIMTSGGNVNISSKVVRLTNTDEDGKIFRITVYKAQNSEGISIDFPADDEGKAWENTIKFTGYKDASRSVGDMLFEIYDEQSVAA